MDQAETAYRGEGADRRQGDVDAATNHLTELGGQLLDSIAALGDRLSPILRPTEPEPGPEGPESELKKVDPLRSPLGGRLWKVVAELNEANLRLRGLIEKVEV